MAARYILIEFDDEASASRLREQINRATESGKQFRVVGLFAKPSNYCQCDPRKHVTDRNNRSTLRRGKKYGWWVCLECRRPTATFSGLVNLIKPRDIIKPPKWMSRHWKGAANFEAMHYIPTLSGYPIGKEGVDFWNER